MIQRLAGLIILLIICSFTHASTKNGHKIKFRINGLKDTVVYLVGYYGEKADICDTAIVDDHGRFEFSKPEPLEGGIYFVGHRRTKLFEFIIDQSQYFSMETDVSGYTKNMKVKNSPENQLYYDYLADNRAFYPKAEPWQKVLNHKSSAPDSVEMAKKALESISNEIKEYRLKFYKDHKGTFLANFVRALVEPEVPEAPLKAGGKKDSLYPVYYYREHFWDNIDLKDERLIRTPIFQGKIDQYFNKLIYPDPDSVMAEARRMIVRVRPNKEMYKFFVTYLVNFGEVSPIMGMERVFTEMVDAYYIDNQVPWVNPTVLENTIKRSNKLKPLLLGKISPNLIMMDTSMQPQSMQNLKNEYTVLFFWNPECPHCIEEAPKLKKFYDERKSKYDLEVYAICLDTSMRKMKDHIIRNHWTWVNVNAYKSALPKFNDTWDITSTPVIYLLDDKKMIIGKKLMPEGLVRYLEAYDNEWKKTGKPPLSPLKQ